MDSKVCPDSAQGALWQQRSDRKAEEVARSMVRQLSAETQRMADVPSRPVNLKAKFMKPGKDGSGMFRAVLISGPPGIGKTTSAHLVAKLCGFKPIEMNASDTRSKKLLEV